MNLNISELVINRTKRRSDYICVVIDSKNKSLQINLHRKISHELMLDLIKEMEPLIIKEIAFQNSQLTNSSHRFRSAILYNYTIFNNVEGN